MSRWIDADAVIARIAGQMSYEIEVETGNETDCVDIAEELLNDIPSIDIVWCKECKFYEDAKGCLLEDNSTRYGDDFCSYGVRKTNTTAEEKPTPIRDYMVHGERE